MVREFCNSGYPFPQSEFDDLLSECLEHWYRVRNTYRDDGGASKVGYMRVIIRNYLINLAEARQTNKRKIPDEAVSLDAPTMEDEDAPTPADIVASQATPTPREQDLAIDLSEVLEDLTPRQIQICQMRMEGWTIWWISRSLGVHTSTVHVEINRIRKIFTNADLDKYLK